MIAEILKTKLDLTFQSGAVQINTRIWLLNIRF
jgi:hypothetical protein